VSLVEIARYSDVYEADLAAAFLESHGIRVSVTERRQTTIDPLMQRALGIRLLGAASNVEAAQSLLARVQTGESATDEGDEPDAGDLATRGVGRVMALTAWATGGFWGTSLPRRIRAPSWQGMFLAMALFAGGTGVVLLIRALILYPPRG